MVEDRLRSVVAGSDYASTATPIATFARGDVASAWSDYRFDSKDTKRPDAAPRPAMGRWLIASNAWIQALVTGCWWESDTSAAEEAWQTVIASLRVSGRVTTQLPRPLSSS